MQQQLCHLNDMVAGIRVKSPSDTIIYAPALTKRASISPKNDNNVQLIDMMRQTSVNPKSYGKTLQDSSLHRLMCIR